jgi:hypothetical protein
MFLIKKMAEYSVAYLEQITWGDQHLWNRLHGVSKIFGTDYMGCLKSVEQITWGV